MKLLPLLLVCAMILLFGCQSCSRYASGSGQSQTVQVVSVHDGDTMRVLIDGEEKRIRLCGIDAPELKQQLGEASRDHLRSLVNASHKQVVLTVVDTDRYGRDVAEVLSSNGVVLNVEQVKKGYAYLYRQYAANCPHESQMAEAELTATRAKAGVWKYSGALKPWEYRKQQRQSR